MATIIIRKLDETTKKRLRVRAARHARSMEEEAREILKTALREKTSEQTNLYDAIRKYVDPIGGLDLPEVPREPMRAIPEFE